VLDVTRRRRARQSQRPYPRGVPLPRTTTRSVLRLAQAAVVLNVVLVVTGAAVRLTGSGLGCPTWPRCTGTSLATTAELGGHGVIEFGNRLLAVVLEVVGVLLVLAVRRLRTPAPRSWSRLALVQALVVPLQAVLGGLLVLSHLNPYVLPLHFLVSFPLTLAALALVRQVRDGAGPRGPLVRAELRWLTGGLVAAAGLVLVAGTLVTGTGPHAGDKDVRRMPFDPRDVTQLHADLVFLLVGLTIATVVAARALGAPPAVRRAVAWLVGLIVAQGALGYVQYYNGVPALLAGVHVLGASLVFAVAAWAHLSTSGSVPATAPVKRVPQPV
jgi:heme a synthase